MQPQNFDKAPRREFFVQHAGTRAFLDDLGMWTTDRAEARRFNTSLDAIVFCLVRRYPQVQVIGTFNWPGVPDITIPVKTPTEATDTAAAPMLGGSQETI